ncbi:MAG: CPBP family intramembrane glutamic endopeptidase [Pseudomonadota bacterium]
MSATLVAILVATTVYAASLIVLLRRPGANLVEPLFLLGVLGVAFPALIATLTRRPRSTPQPLSRPPSAPMPVLAYLAAFSLLVLGWGFTAIAERWPDEPTQSIAQLVAKLASMALLPALLFLPGSRLRPRFGARRLWLVFVAMAAAFLAFQAVFGRGLTTLRELAPSMQTLAWAIPACWLWQTLEAGLCEELLFRRVLQQRIADATRSQVAAVLWASLLFGLAHAPGLYLRGAHAMEGASDPTPLWAVAYSIAMIAPAGIAFGVLWARTRSLWLVVALHGTVDLLPQLAPFIRAWSG